MYYTISKHTVFLDGIYYHILLLVNGVDGVEVHLIWRKLDMLIRHLQKLLWNTKVLECLITKPKTVELALSHSSRVRGFGGLTTKPKTCKSSIEPFFESVRGIVKICNDTLYFFWWIIWHQISQFIDYYIDNWKDNTSWNYDSIYERGFH